MCSLVDVAWRRCSLVGVALRRCSLVGVAWRRCSLVGVAWRRCSLVGVAWRRCSLVGVAGRRCSVVGVDPTELVHGIGVEDLEAGGVMVLSTPGTWEAVRMSMVTHDVRARVTGKVETIVVALGTVT